MSFSERPKTEQRCRPPASLVWFLPHWHGSLLCTLKINQSSWSAPWPSPIKQILWEAKVCCSVIQSHAPPICCSDWALHRLMGSQDFHIPKPPSFIFPSLSCLQASSLMGGQPLLDHQSPVLGSCHQCNPCIGIVCFMLCPARNRPLMRSGVLSTRLLPLVWRQQQPLPHLALCSRYLPQHSLPSDSKP